MPLPDYGIALGTDSITNELLTLTDSDVTSHLDIIGKIGSGKTTLQQFIALQFIARGIGVCYVDPHGDAIEYLISHIPVSRLQDIILIAPGNDTLPTAIGMPLIHRTNKSVDKDMNRLLHIFLQLWGPGSSMHFYGPLLEWVLTMCIKTLLLTGYTFSELPLLLRVPEFRKKVLRELEEKHPEKQLLSFMWEFDFNKLSSYLQHEKSFSTLNKIYRLLDTEAVPLIASQPHETLNWRSCIDEGKIILLDVSNLDEETQKFLAAIYLSTFFEAAYSRQDIPERERSPYALIIDEFNKFAFPQMTEVFRELRKFGIMVTVGYQVRHTLPDDLQGALQNVANHVAFTIGKDDAQELASTFAHAPQPEYQDREIKLPAKRPIDFLVLSGRPHSNEALTTFFYSFEPSVRMDSRATTITPGQPISKTVYEQRFSRFGPQMIEKHVYGGRTPSITSPNERTLDELNNFLYTVMIAKDAHMGLPIDLLMRYFISPCFEPESIKKDGMLYSGPDKHKVKQAKICLLAIGDEDYPHIWHCEESAVYGYFTSSATEERRRYLSWLDTLNAAYANVQAALTLNGNVHYVKRYGYPTTAVLLCKEPEMLSRWTDEYYEAKLQEAKDVVAIRECKEQLNILASQREKFQKVLAEHDIAYLNLTPHDFTWKRDDEKLVFQAQGKENKTEAIEQEALRRARENIALETPPYPSNEILSLVIEQVLLARQILTALVADPILIGTGEMELVEVRRRPVSDMIAEMELDLQRLPKYTAMVNRRGYDDEGLQIAMVSPHVIETVFPTCSPEAYEKRMETIISQTNTYGTDKEKIKAWLQSRHTSFLSGGGVTIKEVDASENGHVALPAPPLPVSALPTKHPLMPTADYLELIYYLSNLTLQQAMQLTGSVDSKREREKLTRLVDAGLLDTSPAVFLSTGGRAPLVYSCKKRGYERLLSEKGLQPIKQGDFNRHSYTVNEFCIAAICGAKEKGHSLVGFEHEKQFRQKGIMLEKNKSLEPDAWLQFFVNGNLQSIFLEIDLSSEGTGVLADKVQKYLTAIKNTAHPGFSASQITIAFILPDASEKEENRLLRIIEDAVKNNPDDAAYFLVASVNLSEITPSQFLTDEIFRQPFDRENTYSLIETNE